MKRQTKALKKQYEELADKMLWEGGLASFVLDYGGPRVFDGLPFYDAAVAFEKAYDKLKDAMDAEDFPWEGSEE